MMRVLHDHDLLTAWERGLGQPPLRRALTLLAVEDDVDGENGGPPDALAALPIGRRNARLLALRERVFGTALDGIADCPACGARLELSLRTTDLRAQGVVGTDSESVCVHDGFDCRFRPPNSYDLADALASPDPERQLLDRCVVDARRDGESVALEDLPPALIEVVERRMAEADPLADIGIDLACPDCGQGWAEPFDVVAFFWAELNAWAVRLVHDVHTLASAYGWSEAAILGMHAWRRRLYLEVLGG